MIPSEIRDLCVLCPDQTWLATLQALLDRPQSLDIRGVSADVKSVPGQTDGWVRQNGVVFLEMMSARYRHAILVFDHQGCGDSRPANVIERELQDGLRPAWGDRACAIVVDPELEEWVIGSHAWLPNLAELRGVRPREWFQEEGLWRQGEAKPDDPKEALHRLFRRFGVAQSAATYRKIASHASLRSDRCRSSSYPRFVETLRRWFPPAWKGPPQ